MSRIWLTSSIYLDVISIRVVVKTMMTNYLAKRLNVENE